MKALINQYFSNITNVQIIPITSGLINQTFRLVVNQQDYILQSINTQVFKNPEIITTNILEISSYLQAQNYPKAVVNLIANANGTYLTLFENKIWRLSAFVAHSVCYEKVQATQQAFEAAKALSEFHSYLLNFPIHKIQPSIPGFLDYEKRIDAFNLALQNGNTARVAYAQPQIQQVLDSMHLVRQYLTINFPLRVVHADAKISNFLFDATRSDQVLAVIDWDTILPGNILCDFGDMIRTYANLRAEDDPNPENVFSIENYKAVKKGFLTFLENKLTPSELQALDLTAKVVILIQAIRFLTDYLTDDAYYYTRYEHQNLDRTKNQLNLLEAVMTST